MWMPRLLKFFRHTRQSWQRWQNLGSSPQPLIRRRYFNHQTRWPATVSRSLQSLHRRRQPQQQQQHPRRIRESSPSSTTPTDTILSTTTPSGSTDTTILTKKERKERKKYPNKKQQHEMRKYTLLYIGCDSGNEKKVISGKREVIWKCLSTLKQMAKNNAQSANIKHEIEMIEKALLKYLPAYFKLWRSEEEQIISI